MTFHFGWISGFMVGFELEYPSEWTPGHLIIDLGIIRFVGQRQE